MRVAATQKHARLEKPLLSQDHMTDTLHIKEMWNLKCRDEFPRQLQNCRGFRVHGWREMIRHDDDLCRIPDADTQFFQARPDASGSA